MTRGKSNTLMGFFKKYFILCIKIPNKTLISFSMIMYVMRNFFEQLKFRLLDIIFLCFVSMVLFPIN